MDTEESSAEEMVRRFQLTCRNCGSINVVVSIEEGISYGGQTGYQEGHFSIGCNDCKQNDMEMSL